MEAAFGWVMEEALWNWAREEAQNHSAQRQAESASPWSLLSVSNFWREAEELREGLGALAEALARRYQKGD